jgi:hypothetical protein
MGRPRTRSGTARAVALLERGAAIPSSTHGALDAGSDTIIDPSHAVVGLVSLVMAALVTGAPLVAHACPMCFVGGENNDAFLVGSIFLMVVPVLSLGGLGYWAYRRLKAIDDGEVRPDADGTDKAPNSSSGGVVLQISPRR